MILNILHYAFVVFFVLFFFGFCIFIHELGHFLAAKWRKMHIVAFSIGFKKIWSYRHNGIEYRIGCLPFGGYVDIPQLESSDEIKDKFGRTLPPITPINRIIVAFAGPFFNILFGFALGTFLWIHGLPEGTPRMDKIEVAEVVQNSPEYNAGLRAGDEIVKINGNNFYDSWSKILQEIIFTVGDVSLGIKQPDGNIKTIKYLPEVNKSSLEAAEMAKEGLPYPYFSPAIPIVIQVEPGSDAQKIGLKTNDQILKVNDYKPLDFMEYIGYVAKTEGAPINLTILRNKEIITLNNIKPIEYKTEDNRYIIGVYPELIDGKIVISQVSPNSPASEIGLKEGDVIVSIGGKALNEASQLTEVINATKDKPLKIVIDRAGKNVVEEIKPKLAVQDTFYYIPGISVIFKNHINPLEQFTNVISMSYNSIKGIFSKDSKIKAKHLSGPVGIISIIGKAVYMGMIIQALNIVTIITFCLALMNLLPLPILDGGHILISIIEIIIRRHLPSKLMQPICMFFAILLIALMLFATFNDVNRLVNFGKWFSFGKKEVPASQQQKAP